MKETNEIFDILNIRRAWQIIRSKNRTGGIDNKLISDIENETENNLNSLQGKILAGNYSPEAYKTIYIPKDNDKRRKIALPTIEDKIIQTCILIYFQPIFEKLFSANSYAYRLNKNHSNSINRINEYVKSGLKWFITCDINNFFDSIDREILMRFVQKYFENDYVCNLIEIWIRMGNVYKENYHETSKGIPQGMVLSPLLSNIYLNDMDSELDKRKIKFVRYCDNILICDYIKAGAEEKNKFLNAELDKLKLSLNEEQTEINHRNTGFSFCGIFFINGKRIISPSRLEKKKLKITEIIRKSEFREICGKINEYFEGLKKYFAKFDTRDQFILLEEHLLKELYNKILELTKDKIKFKFRDELKIVYSIKFLNDKNPIETELIYRKLITNVRENLKKQNLNLSDSNFVNKKINQKRKKYYKIFYSNVDLMITSPGTQLGKSGENISIRNAGSAKKELSAEKVKNIIISSAGVTISSDLLKLCSDKEVRIDVLDNIGKPVCSIVSPASDFYHISSEQSNISHSKQSSVISRDIIISKIKNQANLLKYFIKNKNNSDDHIKRLNLEIEKIENVITEINGLNINNKFQTFRDQIFGFEGISASIYWNCVNSLLPPEYNFEKREHKGSRDLVNMLFNYAYGILYTKVFAAVTIAGLNPGIGFFHTRQKGKPVLVYDIIEQFRAPFADRAVISLLTRGTKVSSENDLLTKETKNLLANKVLSRLNTVIVYKGKRINNNSLILEKTRELVSFITGRTGHFKPFVMKW